MKQPMSGMKLRSNKKTYLALGALALVLLALRLGEPAGQTGPYESQLPGELPTSPKRELSGGVRASAITPAPAYFNPPPKVFRAADILEGAAVLDSWESAPDSRGIVRRVRIFQTGEKYPVIRVQERVRVDEGQVVSRLSMVGDHVMVRLRPNKAVQELAAAIEKWGGTIRKVLPASGLVLVQFKGGRVGNFEIAMRSLSQEQSLIEKAEPDLIVGL
jgi:hypothetical protein